MLIRLTRRLARRYRRAEVTLVRWNTDKPLRRRLSRTSDQALDRALSAARMERGDLFTPFKGNARHRKRLAAMMTRFGVDRALAAEVHWPALREADSLCADCPNVRRCARLLRWGVRDDAARVFCPNAALFDEIARAGRSGTPTSLRP